MADEVRIDPPIQEWMRLFRQTPERVDLQVRKRFREIAADVRDEARGRAGGSRPMSQGLSEKRATPSRGAQHWKDLVNSIKSGSTGRSPHVSIGSARVPWALGQEFGSKRYRQFPPHKGGSDNAGYFVYPAFRAKRSDAMERMAEALREGMANAFPE